MLPYGGRCSCGSVDAWRIHHFRKQLAWPDSTKCWNAVHWTTNISWEQPERRWIKNEDQLVFSAAIWRAAVDRSSSLGARAGCFLGSWAGQTGPGRACLSAGLLVEILRLLRAVVAAWLKDWNYVTCSSINSWMHGTDQIRSDPFPTSRARG